MIAVVVLTNILFPPVPRKGANARDTVAAKVQAQPQANAPATIAAPTSPPTLTAAPVAGAARVDTVIVESPLFRYGISTNGAAIVSAEMLPWKSFTRPGPVQLAPRWPRGLLAYRMQVGDQQVDLATLPFTASSRRVTLQKGGAPQTVRFTYSGTAAGTIEVDYEFTPDNYVVDVKVTARGMPQQPSRLLLDFGPRLAINEAHAVEDERALSYVVNSSQEGIHSFPFRVVKDERINEGPLDWVAIKNKYFVAAAIVSDRQGAKPFGGVLAEPGPDKNSANIAATLPADANGAFSYKLYIGPQDYGRLSKLGHRFQDVNPYGWRILRPIIRPLGHAITWAVLGLHNAIGISYGWILIIFGVAIRLILWPLNAKAMRSQLKNMELQPRIKDMQTRYKNEPEKLQREMLKLYKEEGFNPMGGCLPMLIPFPVLITLFFVFQSTIQFRGVPFLWLPDLSRADPLYILPIILGATMLLQQWLSSKTTPPNPQMKFMMWFMPVFMMMIFFNLASGLNLYYAAQNIPGFFQQMQLTRERERYQREKAASGAVGKTSSGGGGRALN